MNEDRQTVTLDQMQAHDIAVRAGKIAASEVMWKLTSAATWALVIVCAAVWGWVAARHWGK